MSEALVNVPTGGWTVDDLDSLPESHHRYELTDGALSVSPSPSSLYQTMAARLLVRLEALASDPFVVTQAGKFASAGSSAASRTCSWCAATSPAATGSPPPR